MRRWAICLLALLLQTSDASSEIFRWTDEAGNLHFAQSIQQVPPQHRKQALAGKRRQERRDLPDLHQGRRLHHGIEGEREVPGSVCRRWQPDARQRRSSTVTSRSPSSSTPVQVGFPCPRQSQPGSASRSVPNTQRITMQTANGKIDLPLVRLDFCGTGRCPRRRSDGDLESDHEHRPARGSLLQSIQLRRRPGCQCHHAGAKPRSQLRQSQGEGPLAEALSRKFEDHSNNWRHISAIQRGFERDAPRGTRAETRRTRSAPRRARARRKSRPRPQSVAPLVA